MEKEFKIRDLRKKDQYKIDDKYLNGYAKLCGVYSTAVYNSLSRHADFNTQQCWPSIEKIAEQHNIDKKTVIKGIKNLEEWNIIKKIKEKDEKTKRQLNNVYILLDKSEWKQSRVDEKDTESRVDDIPKPSGLQGQSRVDERDYKDNTVKDNTIEGNAGINPASPIKNKLNDKTPMLLQEFIETCKNSSQRHIQIIGEWAEAIEPDYNTKGQWQSFIKRNVRPATNLIPFTEKQLQEAFEKIQNDLVKIDNNGKKVGFITRFSLETLLKYI